MDIRRVCVFCGSSPGRRPAYASAARTVGALLAERGLGMVYGGASVGLMGEAADAALLGGGEVIGVIPEHLDARGITHQGLSELFVVQTMHQRKRKMFELADAFISLPGGFGTFEETFEMATWFQLGLHPHPMGLLNVLDYYGPLVRFLDHAVEEQLLKPEHRRVLMVADEPGHLLDRMLAWQPPEVDKWLGPDET